MIVCFIVSIQQRVQQCILHCVQLHVQQFIIIFLMYVKNITIAAAKNDCINKIIPTTLIPVENY